MRKSVICQTLIIQRFCIGCRMSQNCFVLAAPLLPLLIYYIRHPISYQTSDILYPTSDMISDVGIFNWGGGGVWGGGALPV